jgi:nucleotide-binding universal stress UspA family protein
MPRSKKNINERTFKRIVVPVDGSKLSKKAAKIGCYYASTLNCDLIYLHIYYLPETAILPDEETYVPDFTSTFYEHGKSILKEIKGECEGDDINVKTKLIEGVPEKEIIKFVKKTDLVIMGSKGHSAFERLLVGSVTEKVLHHSDSSVMIVR